MKTVAHPALRPVPRLLLASLLLCVGRGVIAPLMVVTLSREAHLAADGIGYLIGTAILLATLYGLYGGHQVDTGNRRRLAAIALLFNAVPAALLPLCRGWLPALALLLLLEASYVLFSILVKAQLSDCLLPSARIRAFSRMYTLNNVGYAIGPALGSLLASRGLTPAFLTTALLALAVWPLLAGIRPGRQRHAAPAATGPGFLATLTLLRHDRTLVLFTIGSLLACIVHGRYTSYLPLCLLDRLDTRGVLHWTAVLFTTNALTVIALQYPIGKRMHPGNLIACSLAGSGLLAASMLGFALGTTLWQWVAAMVVFTLGEIVIVPSAYLFIDRIAPPAHKGSYYGAQQLANLGGGLSPVIGGAVLAHWPSPVLLGLMALAALSGGGFVLRAARAARQQPGIAPHTRPAGVA